MKDYFRAVDDECTPLVIRTERHMRVTVGKRHFVCRVHIEGDEIEALFVLNAKGSLKTPCVIHEYVTQFDYFEYIHEEAIRMTNGRAGNWSRPYK